MEKFIINYAVKITGTTTIYAENEQAARDKFTQARLNDLIHPKCDIIKAIGKLDHIQKMPGVEYVSIKGMLERAFGCCWGWTK